MLGVFSQTLHIAQEQQDLIGIMGMVLEVSNLANQTMLLQDMKIQ